MYPAQTSLIPVQVALARFWEEGGNIFANYPYWYLGTTPTRFLTGPILPPCLVVLHRFLPNLSLFEIMFCLVAISWVMGGIGVYLLVATLKNAKNIAKKRETAPVLAAIFYLFGPMVPFLFRFSDGLYLIAFSFLPYVLAFYIKVLRKFSLRPAIFLGLFISFVILLDAAIIPTMALGMAAVFLAQVGWRKAEEKLKKSFLIFAFSFLLPSLWYTPGFWLISLTGPSLAGKPRVEVMFQLSKLLPTALAFGVAIFSVKFFKKRNLRGDFCLYWLFIFGFLSLMRFISDPDFWLDWINYGVELQMGLAVLGGLVTGLFLRRQKYQKLNIKNFLPLLCALTFYLLLFTFLFHGYVLGTLQKDITQTVEYQIGKKLLEIVKPGEKVFLSGTTVFWLNAFFDVPQVRGGVDQVSVHPAWRRATWEIREGTEPQKSVERLRDLEVSWLVVHTQESEEFYHDFVYPEKFEEAEGLEKVYERRGDRIYQVLD